MTDHDSSPSATRPTERSRGLLTPQSGAVAALALAVLGLNGQNLMVLAVQAVLGQGFTNRSAGPVGYFVTWGVATLLMVGLVLLLARPALAAGSGWAGHVARAAVLLAAVVAVSGLALVLAGVLEANGALPLG